MAKLLHIESSPRKQRSKSIEVTGAFLNAYRSANPNDEVVTIDLWSTNLPEFDGYTIDAKYQVLHGQDFDDDQGKDWQAVVITSRGGGYGGEASGMDHQKPYVEQILGFFGFTDIHHVVIEPTLAAPHDVAGTVNAAIDHAKSLAGSI